MNATVGGGAYGAINYSDEFITYFSEYIYIPCLLKSLN
jgi:hypothetical protein